MIKEHSSPNALVCLGLLLVTLAVKVSSQVPKPTEAELAQFVGQPMSSGFKNVVWNTGEPPQTSLFIYAVTPPKYDETLLKRFAEALSVKGIPERMPGDFIGAPGFWIREFNPTNRLTWKSVYFSQVSGQLGYASGEDNHRWDIKNHRPNAAGVPTAKEALGKILALLPILGFSTNDLEHNTNGTLRWSTDVDETGYTDRRDGKRKRYIRQMNVTLWQRVPAGGSTLSIGSGGSLRAGFMSEGKLAELEVLFRHLQRADSQKGRTADEVSRILRRGAGRTFRELLPDSITVTNCAVVYPQGNVTFKQTHVWPFYAIRGFAHEENGTGAVNVYVPLAWP